MKFERTFATFRIAGDNLVPEQITRLLNIEPTLAYAKGAHYRRGPHSPELVGRTGIWYFSTDQLKSDYLEEHVNLLLHKLFADKEKLSQLKRLIEQNSLRAVMTFFWAGPPGAKPPVIPKQQLSHIFKSIPVEIEEDFDTDAGPPSREPIHVF
jgi:hypothetical protein